MKGVIDPNNTTNKVIRNQNRLTAEQPKSKDTIGRLKSLYIEMATEHGKMHKKEEFLDSQLDFFLVTSGRIFA